MSVLMVTSETNARQVGLCRCVDVAYDIPVNIN